MTKDIVVRFIADTRNFEAGAKKSKGTIESFKDSAVSAFKKLTPSIIGTTAAIAGLTFGLTKAIAISGELETLKTSFETMLGSSQAALQHLNELRAFSVKTPFEIGDLASASQTLLQFGVNINDMLPTLRMLGDVAGSDRNRFQSLALVFGQIQSTGKLMGQDLLQLINQGFNPLQVIAEKSGKSVATLKDEMSKGQISAEMVTEAFRIATSEGGKFFGNLEAQSKTMGGLWSTLIGAAKDLALAFTGVLDPTGGQTFWTSLKAVLNDVVTGFQVFVQAVGPELQRIGATIGAVFQAIWDVVKLIGTVLLPILAPGFAALKGTLFVVLETIRGIARIVSWVVNMIIDGLTWTAKWLDKIFGITDTIRKFIDNIKVLFLLIRNFVNLIIQDISDSFSKTFSGAAAFWKGIFGGGDGNGEKPEAQLQPLSTPAQRTTSNNVTTTSTIVNNKNTSDNKNIVVNNIIQSESTARRIINGQDFSGMPQGAF